MYLVQLFNARDGVSEQDLIETYRTMAVGWEKAWAGNKFRGLFTRKWGIGAEPNFIAFWELPNAAAMDVWDDTWEETKAAMEGPENDFWASISDLETKLMDKVVPSIYGERDEVLEQGAYFVELFNAPSEIENEKMTEIYRGYAEAWEKTHPTNKFYGLFLRKWGVGAEPTFIAVWGLPDAHAMDIWDQQWEKNRAVMEQHEMPFYATAKKHEIKLMDIVIPRV
jgi:hypothetical protein